MCAQDKCAHSTSMKPNSKCTPKNESPGCEGRAMESILRPWTNDSARLKFPHSSVRIGKQSTPNGTPAVSFPCGRPRHFRRCLTRSPFLARLQSNRVGGMATS